MSERTPISDGSNGDGEMERRGDRETSPHLPAAAPNALGPAPCALVGILGGGQLGRMLALAGYPLGMRFRVLDPSPEAPAGHLAELVLGDFDDEAALEQLAAGADVVTYEFENVPARTAALLQRSVPVFPPAGALETCQDRLTEKQFFQSLGIPTPAYAPVETEADLHTAVADLGLPAVLKTRRCGYDGKGQRVLREERDVAGAWEALGGVPLILEGWVPFQREVSILGVRGRAGEVAFYPLVENHHPEGILALTLAPAPSLEPEVQHLAESYARVALERLDYVGVLAIELFLTADGQLIANEMAPRVHNSGHWSIEGAETSQFENHLRAVAGLPLGSTAPRGFSAMVNLLGEHPDAAPLLSLPGAHLHLYGKSAAPGRKLGHLTLRADSEPELHRLLAAAGAALTEGSHHLGRVRGSGFRGSV